MTHTLEVTIQEDNRAPQRIPFAALTIIAAASGAFIFGLLAMLSWQGCLMIAFTSGALAGGAVFTVLESKMTASNNGTGAAGAGPATSSWKRAARTEGLM